MIREITRNAVGLLPRVYGKGDTFAVLVRSRDDECSLYVYATEDERDMSMDHWDERTDVKAAARYNIV